MCCLVGLVMVLWLVVLIDCQGLPFPMLVGVCLLLVQILVIYCFVLRMGMVWLGFFLMEGDLDYRVMNREFFSDRDLLFPLENGKEYFLEDPYFSRCLLI